MDLSPRLGQKHTNISTGSGYSLCALESLMVFRDYVWGLYEVGHVQGMSLKFCTVSLAQ